MTGRANHRTLTKISVNMTPRSLVSELCKKEKKRGRQDTKGLIEERKEERKKETVGISSNTFFWAVQMVTRASKAALMISWSSVSFLSTWIKAGIPLVPTSYWEGQR